MDVGGLTPLERLQLEQARAKLDEAERAYLDNRCAVLRSKDAYSEKYELELALEIKDTARRYLADAVRSIERRAIDEARENELKAEQQAKTAPEIPAQQQDATPQKDAPQAVDEVTKQQRIYIAAQIQNKDEIAARTWVGQAESLERQQHQHGRYDALRGGNSPPRAGGQPTGDITPPRGPSNPAAAAPLDRPIGPNEVLARFSDPRLQARYEQQEQAREQQTRSASSTPATPATGAPRGDVPPEKRDEQAKREARNAYFKPITRETERAHEREHENQRDGGLGGGRGGRGGR